MISVSDVYQKLIESNIRPKVEPIITVTGIDNEKNPVEITWNAKDIKSLKFNRGSDPIGRELPYMELQWTEIYNGEFNSENFPLKYNNVAKYMAVELSFVQDLGFYNTWKILFNGGFTWKSLLSKTWKQIKNSVSQEIIIMPKMFLSARPTISGQTITWVAKDLLYFLDDMVTMRIYHNFSEPSYLGYLNYGLESILEKYENQKEIHDAITKTIENVKNNIISEDIINSSVDIIVNTSCKDFVSNYLKLRCYNLFFCEDGSFSVKPYNPTIDKNNKISSNILYSKPTLTRSLDVSKYNFKRYWHTLENETGNYEVSDYIIDKHSRYVFYYHGLGYALQEYQKDVLRFLMPDVHKVLATTPDPVVVTPIKTENNTFDVTIDPVGEVFQEDNPLNPYGLGEIGINLRTNLLKEYFKSNFFDVDFNSLSTLQYEPLDCVFVDLNLKDEPEKPILINYIGLEYKGAIKQTIRGHQIS